MFWSFSRHSPFRQQKTKDKHEIDKLTLTMVRHVFKSMDSYIPFPFFCQIKCLFYADEKEKDRRVPS